MTQPATHNQPVADVGALAAYVVAAVEHGSCIQASDCQRPRQQYTWSLNEREVFYKDD
jgi:hypothetical protein